MAFFHRRAPESTDALFVVVGLGNPGSRYADTRHNVGAMAITFIAERHEIRLGASKHAAHVGLGDIGAPAVLAVPDTFMNESGIAVGRLVRYYKAPPTRLLVLCDDLDIPFGTLRIRPDGSAGGNNGLKSIVQNLGTQAFPRLRIGIGRPEHGAIDHVLGRFPPHQQRALPDMFDLIEQAVVHTLRDGVTDAMNRFNRDWLGATVAGEQTDTQ